MPAFTITTAPQRPCSACNGRQWQQRTTHPVGGWECAACTTYREGRRMVPVTDADLSHDPEHMGPLLKLVHAVVKERDVGCWAVQRCAGCPLPRCTLDMTRQERKPLETTINERRNAALAAVDAGQPYQDWRLGAGATA